MSFPGPPMKVTERFELFLSVSLPLPPTIVIDGIVELTEPAIVTLSFESPTLTTIGEVSEVTGPQLSCVPLAEQPPRAVTPPVGSSMIRFPLTTETVTVFTSPAAAV